ncbi:sodium-dependent transporter [Bdellovibrio sp. HCB337]|uniref:sodium-dependent transporter n=1 Tax=Bdellovibrio sp. HCB337 TaxID=3394358 RepID=UPI0039A574FC
MVAKRGSWRTRFGFYLLAIGSACGLGNLWRFPYVVGENGGGAFVLLYVFMALTVGLPLLIAELSLGKSTRQSVLMATQKLTKDSGIKAFVWAGRFSVLLSLVVFSYYAVISGWVLHFLSRFIIEIMFPGDTHHASASLALLMKNGSLQWALASVHVLLTIVVVGKGVQEGLEKWISYMMPLFAALVLLLLFRSASLPSETEVLRFLFYPDFSKLTYSSLIHAIGHIFFTLSVGFGTLVTFGSYMRDEDHVPTAGFRVTLVDTLISLVAVMLVFPIAFQASNVPLTDPALLFETLPRFLMEFRGGLLFGLLFFSCLYMAALNASIGLMETIVSNLVDSQKKRLVRTRASWVAGAVALALATIPAFSSSVFRNVQIDGKGLMELMDSILINWILPVAALGLVISINWGMSEKEKASQFIAHDRFVSHSMYPHWKWALRWYAPGFIIFGMLLQILGLFLK